MSDAQPKTLRPATILRIARMRAPGPVRHRHGRIEGARELIDVMRVDDEGLLRFLGAPAIALSTMPAVVVPGGHNSLATRFMPSCSSTTQKCAIR
jgi:hypothetical protein